MKYLIVILLMISPIIAAEPNFDVVGSKQEKVVAVLDFSILGEDKEVTYNGIKYTIDNQGKLTPITFPANTEGWTWDQKGQYWWKMPERDCIDGKCGPINTFISPVFVPVQRQQIFPQQSFGVFGGAACGPGG